ncbi:MAG: polysaccharide deacetylase family protein [Elusimicrobiales bacterium]|nr:polysaccharide deacetylase family protein [Elusimicrobiales bacterium]
MNKIATITLDSDTFVEEISAKYSAEEKEKIITQTYKKSVERIFDVLNKHGIKITLFIISSHLKYSDCVTITRKILSAGNEIGDHSYSHDRKIANLKENEFLKEIENSKNILFKKLNIIPSGFRSPGAEINERMIKILSLKNYLYDSSSNHSFLYSKLKKFYFAFFRKEKYNHYKITNTDLPQKINSIYEFPLTASAFLGLPLFNFFLSPLGKLGTGILNQTIEKKEYLNYVIHLHEFISDTEIKGIYIKKGLMNIFNNGLKEKINFLNEAVKRFKNLSEIKTLKDFYYNLSYIGK